MQQPKKIARAVIIFCLIMAVGIVGIRLSLSTYFKHESAAIPAEDLPKSASVTVLNLPLMVGVDDLRQALEENLPTTYTDRDDDPTGLMVEDYLVYNLERGEFDIQIIEQGILFSFPVSGEVKSKGKVHLGVAKVPARGHASVAGVISGKIAFTILPDWQVKPDLDFSVDIKEALIPIEGVGEISLRHFLEDKLTKKIARKRAKLTDKVLDKNRIRKEVTKAWGEMHRVEQVSDDPPVWARVIPQQIGFKQLTNIDDKALETGLQLKLRTDLYMSETAPLAPVGPLPDAAICDRVSDSFRIRVPFQIDISAINTYLAQNVTSLSRKMTDNTSVIVDRAEVLPSENNRVTVILYATLRHGPLHDMISSSPLSFMNPDIRTRIYLTGQVVHDNTVRQVRLANVSYDAAIRPWWAGLMHWTVYPWLRHTLEQSLVFPLGREMEKAHEAINTLIADLVVPPGIDADLSVKQPRLNRLGVNTQGIFGELQLDGNLRAALDFSHQPSDKEE